MKLAKKFAFVLLIAVLVASSIVSVAGAYREGDTWAQVCGGGSSRHSGGLLYETNTHRAQWGQSLGTGTWSERCPWIQGIWACNATWTEETLMGACQGQKISGGLCGYRTGNYGSRYKINNHATACSYSGRTGYYQTQYY